MSRNPTTIMIFLLMSILLLTQNNNQVLAVSVGQCIAACRTSVAAMEAFCRVPVLPPQVKALCWGVTHYATPAVATCTGFCYNNLK
ncbi:hypothetical protein DFA_11156 [Cavenderia fasciculata]|uniref:Uncharacterized protein n=1 Tax=Cavenderia fasciculata TaxID=261658 RepID=F4QF36_CACFS|nr:uncharacterized protein DFA_11156 [Cavenderia fasciculata]EGG13395.1 hypothetical protein DFA_11156 [Cavenderia fasciculata]|eukprot:XP_004350099.1 hypothetical protein DFA_11156 [Cavenderia fasciculata]